ncbi:MAG: type II secretion system F family protein [Marmoricola sp.]
MTGLLILGIALVFAALFVAFAAVGGLTHESKGVNRSIAVLEALTGAPADMTKELDLPFSERVLLPLLAKVQNIGKRFSGDGEDEALQRKIEIAGTPAGWTPDRVAAGKVLGFVAALLVSMLLSFAMGLGLLPTMAFVVVASIVGFQAPNMYLYQMGYNRTLELEKELADAIDLLTISVESGLGFDAAAAHVARSTEGPIAGEFARMLQEMQLGRSRSEALRSMADRSNVADLRTFVSAMVQADAFGIPIGQVLRVQSSEIRTKKRQRAEEQAQKVAVKILIPLIFCILPCLFIAVLGPAAISILHSFSGKVT